MKHIVLTGGGTAGHVTPNIAMIPALKEQGFTISYIGSYNGIEKKLIEEMGIPYYGISSGKLRRYFDVKNFTDPFRVLKGFSEARKLLKKLKQQDGERIWVCGGACVARQLMELDAVDRYWISVIPVILGGGVPLFPPGLRRQLRPVRLLRHVP